MRMRDHERDQLRLDAKTLEDVARIIELESRQYKVLPSVLRGIAVDILAATDGEAMLDAQG